MVKHQAFLPMRNPETLLLETSVFRISHLKDDEIWDIGQREVIRNSGRRLHGRADIILSKVLENGLSISPDDPPPRHANIVGWPDEESKQKMIAIALAAEAQLRLR
jgi:hypothetical protein